MNRWPNLLRFVILTVTVPLLTACGAKVKSYPYDECLSNVGGGIGVSKEYKSIAAEGFTYALPKTIIEVKGKCTVYRQFFYTDEKRITPKYALFTANLDDGVIVAPKGEVDPSVRFRIDPKALRNWRVNTDVAKFVMSENGVLTQMNTTLDDRTAEIIESTSRTAINVGKMIALAGASEKLIPGLTEKISTFEVSTTIDPTDFTDPVPEREIFDDLATKAEIESQASIIKDELTSKIGPNEMALIVNQVCLGLDLPRKAARTTSIGVKDTLGKDTFGDGLIRFASFEHFKLNYVNGVVSRIPAYATVRVKAKPVVVIERAGLASSNLDAAPKVAALAKKIKDIDELLKNPSIAATVKEEKQKEHDELIKQLSDLHKTLNAFLEPKTIFEASVPISQFGKFAVIPVHSNTFVKQTKNLTINKDSGRIDSYDYSATSSGERFAKMLENISKSAVDELPGILGSKGSAEKK